MKKYGLLLSCLLTFNLSKTVPVEVGTGVSWGPFSILLRKRLDVSQEIILGLVTTAIVSKVAYDVSWHDTYVTTVNGWYGKLKHCIQSNSVDSVNHVALHNCFSQCDLDDIIIMNRWLQSSYGSWVCPWNWTASQKKALNIVQAIEVLTMYSDLLALGTEVSAEEVVTAARKICFSMYPLIEFYGLIEYHIDFIKNSSSLVCDLQVQDLVKSMLPCLNNFKVLLRQGKDYTEELQMKRTHDLQQAMVTAQQASNMYRR